MPSDPPTPLRLAYYGDDFTGSTDALEFLVRCGLRTTLFLDPPTPAQLAALPPLDAIGVAGLTRSLAPDAMEQVLRPAFIALRALGPAHVHYKVCSTFDSSPTIGSIGRALDVGTEIFSARFVPVLVANPALGRFSAFGNLFARYGIGSGGAIHRLDRHPSISRHPVTPMQEADLRAHLALQTAKQIGLLDILALAQPAAEYRAALDARLAAGDEVVLFDLINSVDFSKIGGLLDAYASPAQTLFSVGSSGIEAALATHWTSGRPVATSASESKPASPAKPLLILSGSCSPVTDGQITHAAAQGFVTIALDPSARDHSAAIESAVAALRSGQHTLLYTSRGSATTAAPIPADQLGTALGQLARDILARSPQTRRLVIAGGDTSSYAARALGIASLDFLAPLVVGAPLCRARIPGSPLDGLEVNFKGGQVGAENYFSAVARGHL